MKLFFKQINPTEVQLIHRYRIVYLNGGFSKLLNSIRTGYIKFKKLIFIKWKC